MKKQIMTLALTTLLGLGTAGIVAAAPQQDSQAPAAADNQQGHRAPDPNREVKMLSKRLNLTSDQQNQLLPILTDRQQQVQNIQADSTLSAKDRHAKMRAVREDTDSKIRALLTDDQKQSYDQFRQQQRERMQQHRDQHENGSGPAA